jgi:SnoaL-like protein
MKSNGTKYVLAVFALLAAYFVYVWWFSPTRAVKRQLGRLAATLSVPANEAEIARVARLAQLRRYFAPNVRVTLGKGDVDIPSRDAILAALATLRPPASGWDVQFVDVQVTVDSDVEARAYMTVEVRSEDARTGERSLDAREARLTLTKVDGEWAITTAESPQPLTRP